MTSVGQGEISTQQCVLDACRAAGTPAPRIEVEPGELSVEFAFAPAYLAGVSWATTQETTQEKILALLRAEPTMTRKVLAARIGLTPDGVKYHLDKLRAAGKIRHSGPTKAGRWEVLEGNDG